MREVDGLLRRRPGLGTLAAEARGAPGPAGQGTRFQRPQRVGLTAAELRLLPLLPTHLTFPDIAGTLLGQQHAATVSTIGVVMSKRSTQWRHRV